MSSVVKTDYFMDKLTKSIEELKSENIKLCKKLSPLLTPREKLRVFNLPDIPGKPFLLEGRKL